jgi:hypothetical protein
MLLYFEIIYSNSFFEKISIKFSFLYQLNLKVISFVFKLFYMIIKLGCKILSSKKYSSSYLNNNQFKEKK